MTNDERGFFGIVIPKEIVDDQELNITEKFVFGFIASFRRCCFLSNEDIAKRVGVSESTVAHVIPKLEKKGYIFIEKNNNNNATRKLYSVLDNPKKLAYLMKKGFLQEEGVMQNLQKPMQNLHEVVQNMQNPKTDVSRAKFADIDIEEKKNKVEIDKTEQKPNASTCGRLDGSRLAVRRSEYQNDIEFEKDFYANNTITI